MTQVLNINLEVSAAGVSLEQQLQQAITQARTTSQQWGGGSPQAAAAWDIVEELQAEISHRRAELPTAFERYCANHPDALECRIYEV